MKRLLKVTLGVCLFASAVVSAQAGFSSLYVFGDSLSATADPAPASPYYYGNRDSNGRVWVEVLAQRQGLAFNDSRNSSYYDHNSSLLLAELNTFTPPADVANDLFIVWVCNADTFDAASTAMWSQNKNTTFLLNQFINANIQSQTNHLQIILNLYNKGVRTLVLPNVVDISEIPAFNQGNLTSVLRPGCIDYNTRFAATIKQAKSLCPGLTIITPDFYTLLNNVLASPDSFGLVNALSGGYSIDVLDDPSITDLTLNGKGANYIFWDPQDPTAKFHAVIADVAQQIISPVAISKLTVRNGANRLDLVNVPIGLNGVVESSPNWTLASWTAVTNLNSSSLTQSLVVNAPPLPPSTPAGGTGGNGSIDPNDPNNQGGTYIAPTNSALFYRLHFPFAWSWP